MKSTDQKLLEEAYSKVLKENSTEAGKLTPEQQEVTKDLATHGQVDIIKAFSAFFGPMEGKIPNIHQAQGLADHLGALS